MNQAPIDFSADLARAQFVLTQRRTSDPDHRYSFASTGQTAKQKVVILTNSSWSLSDRGN